MVPCLHLDPKSASSSEKDYKRRSEFTKSLHFGLVVVLVAEGGAILNLVLAVVLHNNLI